VTFYTRKRRSPQVMIVAMIDIFAILLIFVIVTTTFKVPETDQTALSIKLPESSAAAAVHGADAVGVLSVSAKEEIFLDAKPLQLGELAAGIREYLKEKPGRKLAMRADERVSYGFLIKVLDALREGGVQGNLSAFTQTTK
jgi:biopolymer transport protein ExbD